MSRGMNAYVIVVLSFMLICSLRWPQHGIACVWIAGALVAVPLVATFWTDWRNKP